MDEIDQALAAAEAGFQIMREYYWQQASNRSDVWMDRDAWIWPNDVFADTYDFRLDAQRYWIETYQHYLTTKRNRFSDLGPC